MDGDLDWKGRAILKHLYGTLDALIRLAVVRVFPVSICIVVAMYVQNSWQPDELFESMQT